VYRYTDVPGWQPWPLIRGATRTTRSNRRVRLRHRRYRTDWKPRRRLATAYPATKRFADSCTV